MLSSDLFATFVVLLYILFIVVYGSLFIYYFFFVFERRRNYKAFYTAIRSVQYQKNLTTEDMLDQLQISYNNIYKSSKVNSKLSLLLSLETLIYHFDTYSDKKFAFIYGQERTLAARSFIVKLRNKLKEQNPYFEVPLKEATLLQDITDTLDENKKTVGVNLLNRLAQEILSKEKIIKSQNTTNIISITVSIIGLILSTIFGLIQFL